MTTEKDRRREWWKSYRDSRKNGTAPKPLPVVPSDKPKPKPDAPKPKSPKPKAPKQEPIKDDGFDEFAMRAQRIKAIESQRFLYFAYGSNLDAIQMKQRCPSATGGWTASLMGYRLAFTGHSVGWGGAVATIEGSAFDTVYGRVWDISFNDLMTLDGYEGHPFAYERHSVFLDDGTEAYTYFKKPATKSLPSESYIKAIARGYIQAGLDVKFLLDAVRLSV